MFVANTITIFIEFLHRKRGFFLVIYGSIHSGERKKVQTMYSMLIHWSLNINHLSLIYTKTLYWNCDAVRFSNVPYFIWLYLYVRYHWTLILLKKTSTTKTGRFNIPLLLLHFANVEVHLASLLRTTNQIEYFF